MADDASVSMDSNNRVAERELPRREVVAIECVNADLRVEQILAWADAHMPPTAPGRRWDRGRYRGW